MAVQKNVWMIIEGTMYLDDPVWSGRPKTLNSEAMLQAMEANPVF